MGRDSTIYIQSEAEKVIKPSLIIDALLIEGWSYDDNGHISYTVSEDLAQWEQKSLNDWPFVLVILDATFGELADFGLSLNIGNEASGGDFLFQPKANSLTINLTINRKEISSKFRISDYSWYLSRLLKPIESTGYNITSVKCSDYW